jgi:hypothetical protein
MLAKFLVIVKVKLKPPGPGGFLLQPIMAC